MAKDGSEALGSPEVAGTFVAVTGNTKKLAMFGALGAVHANRKKDEEEGGTPAFGRFAYLSIGADNLALVKAHSGMMSMKPKVTSEALTRRPRGEISSVDLDKGALKSNLKLAFANGDRWEFEIPKAFNKGAKSVVQALGGNVS